MWKFPGAHAERRETWFAPHCTPLRRFWDRQSSVWGLCLSHDRSSRRGCSLSVICSVEASVRALKEYGYDMLVASCMLEEGSMPACLSVSLYVSHRSILPIPGSPRRRGAPRHSTLPSRLQAALVLCHSARGIYVHCRQSAWEKDLTE